MPIRPFIAVLVLAAALSGPAIAAEPDLSDANPADLQAVIAKIPATGAPTEQALRRAEAMFRLGDLSGDVGMIRRGADAASAVLASLETGGRGALWVAANKNVGTALVMLARRTNDRGRLDEARGWYAKAIAIDPANVSATMGLGRIGRASTPAPASPLPSLPQPGSSTGGNG